ncbi:MAG: BlaI/MecI/CopY family transcriptional regulator [Streptosporangiaceae bacterium]
MAEPGLLGPLEAEVLDIVRRRGPSTVADVAEQVNAIRPDRPLAYHTVLTVLRRLEGKGALGHERRGRAFHYRAMRSEDQFLEFKAAEATRALLARFGDAALAGFAGELSGDPRRRALLEEMLEDGDHDGDDNPAP